MSVVLECYSNDPFLHLPLSSLSPLGTKHFLLMCNVRPEDSGEIKFIARRVESVAYLDVEGIINIVLNSQCA